MANLYGVANTPPALVMGSMIGGANLNCPAGVETNVLTSGVISVNDKGFYYPVLWVNIGLTMGATAPSAIQLGARIGAGADFNNFQVTSALLVAATTFNYSWYTAGPASQVAWYTPGSTLFISVNPTGQAVTAQIVVTDALMGIFRAPDQ